MTEAGPRLGSGSAPPLTWRGSRGNRATLVVPRAPPWESAARGVRIHTTTVRPTRRTDPPDKRLKVAQETLAELPPADYTVYTDGSAADGVENGGAGPSYTEGRPS